MIKIMREQEFKENIIPYDLKDDAFYISILDPDNRAPLRDNAYNYKTWYFYDLEYDIDTYKAITFEQAQEITEFIR